jgi:hypothetical protein
MKYPLLLGEIRKANPARMDADLEEALELGSNFSLPPTLVFILICYLFPRSDGLGPDSQQKYDATVWVGISQE